MVSSLIHYLERGTCPVDEFISMECSPEEAPLAMEKWVENPGKVFRVLVKFKNEEGKIKSL